MENQRMEAWFVMHYLGKIPNMEYQCFVEESFTNFATKQGDHLSFYPRKLGKCKIHSKLSNLELIFCRLLHI